MPGPYIHVSAMRHAALQLGGEVGIGHHEASATVKLSAGSGGSARTRVDPPIA